ncbi:MAG: hypothetical protein KI790_11760 [Cyclobacteriaceae bacterium]|nr:hypothetical protein [Cyclobacteriaceae bacterium HetDA_MAG_MS6]
MAKKQTRYFPRNIPQIQDKLIACQGNIVFNNGSVLLVYFEQLEKEVLHVKDAMQHKLKLPLSDIKEIWMETKIEA